MTETLTDDEGKTVVDADARKIGILSGVRDGDPYVNPDPDTTEQVMSKLGWSGADTDEDIQLPDNAVETVTDDEIPTGVPAHDTEPQRVSQRNSTLYEKNNSDSAVKLCLSPGGVARYRHGGSSPRALRRSDG